MTPRTPVNDDERIAVAALGRVSYPSASWDKRFARQLNAEALTGKERPQVWRLFWRYRRQIKGREINGVYLRGKTWENLLAKAEQLAAPDFRKTPPAPATPPWPKQPAMPPSMFP